MSTIIGVAGSLRRGSYNAALLRNAVELTPEGVTLEIASIRGIPLYDEDVERESGIPATVAELKDKIAAADGLFLVTPEYNASIPGVLKNAIDWLSRPTKDIPRVFGNKAVAIAGVTPGRAGTRLSQAAWLPVLRTLGTRPWFGKQLYVSDAGTTFDEAGRLTDTKMRDQLQSYMAGFAKFVGRGASD